MGVKLGLTLRKNIDRLSVFENRALRKICRSKRDVVTVTGRSCHEDILDLYSANIIRVIKIKDNEMGGTCGTYGGGHVCTEFLDFGGETGVKETAWKT
jgi:hypothetical protein